MVVIMYLPMKFQKTHLIVCGDHKYLLTFG